MRLTFVLSSLWLTGGNRVVVQYANHRAELGDSVALVVPGRSVEPEMERLLHPGLSVCQAAGAIDRKAGLIKKLILTGQMARAIPSSDLLFATHSPTVPAVLIASALLRKGRAAWLYQDSLGMFRAGTPESWLQSNSLAFFAGALVVMEQARDDFQKRFPQKPVFFVGEGLSDAGYFHPISAAERSQATGGVPTLLLMGDTRPRKGLQDALRAAEMAAKTVPGLRLWIVSKEDFTPETSLPYQFYYRPERGELARLYAACDAFVFASWNESFGLPGLEAMACGAPVVLTDSGGVRAYATGEENCLMVPVRSPELLAQAVIRVLQDSRRAEALRQAAVRTAEAFTWEKAYQRFDASLEHLLVHPVTPAG